jgi:hypothetical protein
MSFEDNPADERHQLDQCLDEIKRLKEVNAILFSACNSARVQLFTVGCTCNVTDPPPCAVCELDAAVAKASR